MFVSPDSAMSLKFRQRSKAGRLLSKKRGHSDVRTLFPEQDSSKLTLFFYFFILLEYLSNIDPLHSLIPTLRG